MRRLFRYIGLFLVLLMAFFGQGCLAVDVATIGYSAFKTAQVTTGGGDIRVEFSDVAVGVPVNGNLSSVKAIAIYPAENGVEMAEALSKVGRFQVKTPNQVMESLIKDSYTFSQLDQLTEADKQILFGKVCRLVNADGLFLSTYGQPKGDSNAWSLKRAEMIIPFKVQFYLASSQSIVWEKQGRVVAELGGRDTNYPEWISAVIPPVVERFVQDATASVPASVPAPVPIKAPAKQAKAG